jgi:hypothetical protein
MKLLEEVEDFLKRCDAERGSCLTSLLLEEIGAASTGLEMYGLISRFLIEIRNKEIDQKKIEEIDSFLMQVDKAFGR